MTTIAVQLESGGGMGSARRGARNRQRENGEGSANANGISNECGYHQSANANANGNTSSGKASTSAHHLNQANYRRQQQQPSPILDNIRMASAYPFRWQPPPPPPADPIPEVPLEGASYLVRQIEEPSQQQAPDSHSTSPAAALTSRSTFIHSTTPLPTRPTPNGTGRWLSNEVTVQACDEHTYGDRPIHHQAPHVLWSASNQTSISGSSAQANGVGHDDPSRRPNMSRSKSEYAMGPQQGVGDDGRQHFGARHGFEDHYDDEYTSQLADTWYMYYTDKRHEANGQAKELGEIEDWRMRDRLKTVSAALCVCLNIGVEPPDQMKTSPGAKLEAWCDPFHQSAPKALENVGKALQSQYEIISLRTRYKQYLDPSVEETKKFCMALRRNAKDERVLFHYNGHGVPKPTASGEIWVFNKSYTQYIPISLFDLQLWLQGPTIYVWDCSEAGNILTNYHRFVEKHEAEENEALEQDATYEKAKYRSYLHLAACAVKENLPTNPDLPADLFTACLTTPIEMALHYFVMQNPLKTGLTTERARKLPGRAQERRSPLGELNWIFTAITDTIAWTSLPKDLFRKFFRQDLMVAALFRNFILAQRVMKTYGCNPQSFPELPNMHQHPLWRSWDLAVDLALSQLPQLEQKERGEIEYEYQSSTFFKEQLDAFEIYLIRGDVNIRRQPEQLPVVLQVLLSQQHRLRALILLGKFLDLGPWAVQLALSIGIFPYVLKLLQSSAGELRPVMVYIWSRILAVDISCQPELVKDGGYSYFATILSPSELLPVNNHDEHKSMCAFIIAMLCKNHEKGQSVCNQTDVMTYCLAHLNNVDNSLLRQWAALCISQLWEYLPEAKWRGIRENAPLKLSALAKDGSPEVRSAFVHAMTTFLGIPDLTDEVARIEESIAWTLLDMVNDASPVVRKELLVFASHFVLRYVNKFLVAAFEQLLDEIEYLVCPPKDEESEQRMGLHYTRSDKRDADGTIMASAQGLSHNTVFAAWWKHILILNVDPQPEVQRNATIIMDYVHGALLSSSTGPHTRSLMDEIQRRVKKSREHRKQSSTSRHSTYDAAVKTEKLAQPAPGLLKRTASLLFQFPLWNNEDRATPAPLPTAYSRIGPQRLRSAAHQPAPPEQNDVAAGPAKYNVAREPVSSGFKDRDLSVKPSLPLTSTFLEWALEYFREPQMKSPEHDEPGSVEHNERLWRRSRNEEILRATQPQKEFAGTHKWNHQFMVLSNSSQPTKLTFHQFEDHLAVADDGNTVNIWNWKKQHQIGRFSNGNPEGSRISDLKFINEDDTAFLMTGSSDGVIRIYRDYDLGRGTELASAWRALTHMVPSNVNSGMVFDWQQVNGRVLVAGDVRVIRVWAASTETCIMDIPARSGSCVTSLTSDQMTGNVFVAGFGDGAVRVFDARLRPQESMVKKWKDEADRQWIKTVAMQRGGQRELLSASRNGKVKLWDIRMDAPLHVFQTTRDTLRTASIHEHLPVFSVGTSAHVVKVFNLEGQELSHVEPYSSFLQQNRGAPISATAFHPHRMVLGCAARGDHHVNLFTCAQSGDEAFSTI